MKNYFILILFSAIFSLRGDFSLNWEKLYGGSDKDYGLDFIKSDQGYIICGRTKSFGVEDWRAFLLKTDNNGEEIWFKLFRESNIGTFNAISLSSDGNYLVIGRYEINMSSNIWVAKISTEGEIIWEKSNLDFGCGYAISEAEDGNIIIGGSEDSESEYAVIAKLDNMGNLLWKKYCGTSGGMDKIKSCIMDSNGDYLFAGYSRVDGDYQAWVLKYSATGELIWDKKYGEDEKDMVISIDECESGYIIAGQTKSYGSSKLNGLVIKLDYQGEIEWVNSVGGAEYDYLNSVCTRKKENGEERYIAAGSTKSFAVNNRADSDGWLVELDANGELVSKLSLGGQKSDFLWSVKKIGDDKFASVGYMNKASGGKADNYQTWLVNFNLSEVGINEITAGTMELLQNYPNPFNPKTTIKFYNSSLGEVKLSVYNLKGEEVARLVNGKMEQGFNSVEFDATHLNSGVYFYKLETKEKNLTKKMILVK